MVLKELKEYSERHEQPPRFYAEGPARYWINLDRRGRFLPPVIDTADPSSPRTRRGQRRRLPQVARAYGIRPLLLADKADYTLGLATDEKRASRARACHQAYVELVERCALETGDPDVAAVLTFLGNDPLGQVQPGDGFDPSGILSFQVDGRVVIDNPAVQAFWETANSDPDAPVMQCLVCGNRRPVLSRLQAKVKGIPGGQSAGTSLISANAAAFESYGLTESLTSPICSNCAEGFTRGINDLLADNRSRFASGDSVSVFWTKEEQEFDYLAMMENPEPTQVRSLMESVRTGRPVGVDDNSFYAISLSASGGRATVRDWMDTTVGRVKANLAAWFQGQRIAPGFDGETRYYGLRALAFATVREPRDLPRTTPRTLVHAAFTGTPLPMDIMAQAVRRNRAEQRITRPRAALIKLALASHRGDDDLAAPTHGTLGRKATVPYVLYLAYGFFNPHFARQTGATSEDLEVFWNALVNMWDLDRSSARGLMSCRGLYVFSHESSMGNAPAHRLFDLISAQRKDGVEAPRKFRDYKVTVDEARVPEKVTLTKLEG